MKRRFLLPALSAAALSTATFASSHAYADCNDPFGKPNELLDFHLKISKADWEKLLASTIPNVDGATVVDSPACAGKFPKFKAEFRCGTTGDWIKIGVRKKKGTERGNEVPNKPPIKLDFNEDFPDDSNPQNEAKGQRWPKAMGENGFRKITMNNGHGNKPGAGDVVPNFRAPLLLTEHMALRLVNREVPSAPQTAFAKLTVHLDGAESGDNKGVYIIAEDLDRSAIKKRFGSAAGRLIKASTPDCSPEVQYDDSTEGGKQPTPYESTKKFKEWADENVANKSLEDAENALDLDALLRQEAIREILVNGNDTITNSRAYLEWEKWGEGNNWYAFDPEKGKRQYMPWDMDLAFGNQRGACTTKTEMALANPPPPSGPGGPAPEVPPNPTIDTYGKWQCPPDMPITDFCNMPPKTASTPRTFSRVGLGTVCNPNVKKKYLETMCTLINGPMSADEIIKLWDAADKTINAAVYEERNFNYEGSPLDEGVLKSYGYEYRRLRAWIPKRIKSVRDQINALGVECKEGCNSGDKQSCSYNGGEGERVCNDKLWSPCQKKGGNNTPSGGVTTNGGGDKGGCSFVQGNRANAGTRSGLALLVPLFALGTILRRRRKRS